MEGGTGVSFPDEALVAEVAAIEAARPAETVAFRWVVGVAWALVYAMAGGALLAILFATAEIAGTGDPLSLLR